MVVIAYYTLPETMSYSISSFFTHFLIHEISFTLHLHDQLGMNPQESLTYYLRLHVHQHNLATFYLFHLDSPHCILGI